MWVVAETDVESILGIAESEKPDVIVVDSIQNHVQSRYLFHTRVSVSQVRDSAMRLMFLAKNTNIPVMLVGAL